MCKKPDIKQNMLRGYGYVKSKTKVIEVKNGSSVGQKGEGLRSTDRQLQNSRVMQSTAQGT